MNQTSLTIIHCTEDSLAAHVTEHLLDRTVAERAEAQWVRDLWDPAVRPAARLYVDLAGLPGRSNRPHVKARRLRFHPRGLSANAAHAYVCFRLASALDIEGDRLLLLSFDTDGRPIEQRCARGIIQAAGAVPAPMRVVIAEATPEFDGWVLAGFIPRNDHEHRLLTSERDALGRAGYSFDPVRAPHLLTSTIERDARDAKKVCGRLLQLQAQAGPEDGRVRDCLDAPLHTLRANGAKAGLEEFIRDVETVVLPLLEGGSRIRSPQAD